MNMKQIENREGYVGVHPVISKVSFEKRGYITLILADGRMISAPLKLYPSIKKMNVLQRKKYHITGDQVIIWNDCDEIFHIEQFLGREQDYSYATYQKSII
jgi:hypothetical protein